MSPEVMAALFALTQGLFFFVLVDIRARLARLEDRVMGVR